MRFYGRHQLICSSSSICNIWSVEVWVACFAETRSRLYVAMSVINGKRWWRKTLMKGWLSPRRCPVIWPSFIQHEYMCVAIALSVPGKIVSKSRYLGHADGIVASPRRHLAKKLSSLVGTRHVEVDRNRGVKIILGTMLARWIDSTAFRRIKFYSFISAQYP